ncbi:MAG: hypothetical protein AAGU32_01080, partial [Bacillota bacterium]
ALGMLTGGILGLTVGGPGGAAIGVLLGAGVSLAISELLFNGDGKLDPEEIISGVVFALGVIAGGIIGLVAGGPAGAAVGIIVGAGVSALVSSVSFDGDGKVSIQEVLSMIRNALIIICAGALIGASVGGPGGAALGVVVGVGIVAMVSGVSFDTDGDGRMSTQEILSMIRDALIVVCAGALGFGIGGPAGAALAVIVTSAVILSIKKVSFSDKTSSKKTGYDEGEQIGGNVTEGTKKGLGINSASNSIEYEGMGSSMMQGMANGIEENSNLVTQANESVLSAITESFNTWQGNFMLGFDAFEISFAGRWKTFWYDMHVLFVDSWNNILGAFQDGCNNAIRSLNELVSSANSLSGLTGKNYKFASNIVIQKLPIPKLATGAVIPPNREFLAVLGDQKSGNNYEVPDAKLRQLIREETAHLSGGGDQTVILQVDRDQLGKVVYKLNRAESRRIGVRFVEV